MIFLQAALTRGTVQVAYPNGEVSTCQKAGEAVRRISLMEHLL